MTSVLTRGYYCPTATEKPVVGHTKLSLVGTDHLGWLLCDGRSLDVLKYSKLYNVIRNTYGGNSSTFNLPNQATSVAGSGLTTRKAGDISGGETPTLTIAEIPRHDNSITEPGLTRTRAGDISGEEMHTLTIEEMPTHDHTITDPGHDHTYSNEPNTASPAVSLTTTNVADNSSVGQRTGTSTTGITINNTGGNGPHNNIQPTLFVGNMFIYSGQIQAGTYPPFGGTLY